MILTVLVPFERPTPHVSGLCATISMLTEDTGTRLVAVQYGEHPRDGHERIRSECLHEYLRAYGWAVRTEATRLSEVWNLGAMLARVHAEMHNDGIRDVEEHDPWGLIVVDPHVRLGVDTLGYLAGPLELGMNLCYDAPEVIDPKGPAQFDGRLFGFAHEDAGILLTSHEHDDPETCGMDLLASLDPMADVVGIPTGSTRIP